MKIRPFPKTSKPALPPFSLRYGREGTAHVARVFVAGQEVFGLIQTTAGIWTGSVGTHFEMDRSPARVAAALITQLSP